MLNILVCDDNLEELDEICQIILDYYGENSSIAKFHEPEAALAYVEDGHEIDIAILDIVMQKMDGIKLAEYFRSQGFEGYLVFLSNFNDFAAESYSVRAFSYILKPVSETKIRNCLDEIEKIRLSDSKATFALKSKGQTRLIFFSELIYAEVNSHNLYFHLINGETLRTYASLKDYAAILLNDARMAQCNKSFIVNMDHIKTLENNSIIMKNGVRISISKTFSQFRYKCLKWLFGKAAVK